MKSQLNTKSSDELEKEVRHEIRNVRKDIDELSGRFSPGQIIDDVIFYPHGKSPAATFDHLRRNPVGTAFLSLGTILLMEDEQHQSLETLSKNRISTAKSKVSEFTDKVKTKIPGGDGMSPSTKELAMDKVNAMRDKLDGIEAEVEYKVAQAQDKFDTVKEEAQEKIQSLKGAAEQKLGSVKNVAEEKIDSFKSTAQDTFAAGSEGSGFSSGTDQYGNALPELPDVGSMKNKVTDKVSGFMSAGKDKVRDLEPVTFMALGAGLGILTGASLPVSEAERNFVDSKLQDKLSGFSGDLQAAMNECSNILKDLVISDVKDFRVNLF